MTSLHGILWTELNFRCLNVNEDSCWVVLKCLKIIISLMHWAIACYTWMYFWQKWILGRLISKNFRGDLLPLRHLSASADINYTWKSDCYNNDMCTRQLPKTILIVIIIMKWRIKENTKKKSFMVGKVIIPKCTISVTY